MGISGAARRGAAAMPAVRNVPSNLFPALLKRNQSEHPSCKPSTRRSWPHQWPSSCARTATTCSWLACSMSVSYRQMRLLLPKPYLRGARVGQAVHREEDERHLAALPPRTSSAQAARQQKPPCRPTEPPCAASNHPLISLTCTHLSGRSGGCRPPQTASSAGTGGRRPAALWPPCKDHRVCEQVRRWLKRQQTS